MEWAKISTSLLNDPRLAAAGPEALIYHLAAILYCKEQETDGVVPARVARRLAATWVDDPVAARDACVEHSLLRLLGDGSVVVKGWLSWNPSAEQIAAQRAGARERQQRHRHETPAQELSRRDGTRDSDRESRRLSSREEVEVEEELEVEVEVDGKPMSSGKRSTAISTEAVTTVWDAYQAHHPQAALTDKRRKLIRARLGEGRSPADLIEAIEGCHRSAFHMGENDRLQRYDSIELILRDAGKVEGFMRMSREPQGKRTVTGGEILRAIEGG